MPRFLLQYKAYILLFFFLAIFDLLYALLLLSHIVCSIGQYQIYEFFKPCHSTLYTYNNTKTSITLITLVALITVLFALLPYCVYSLFPCLSNFKRGASLLPTSKVRTSTTLLFLSAANQKLRIRIHLWWKNIYIKFNNFF